MFWYYKMFRQCMVVIFVFFVFDGADGFAQEQSGGSEKQTDPQGIDLCPSAWPVEELEAFHKLNLQLGTDSFHATGKQAVVAGTTSASAIRAGLEALKQGGSAADAALTTSLTQVALAKGAWVSYAGIITMVYFDATSGQVYNMNAGYNTFANEDDPASIPQRASGRTALVPGFMAGVESAHTRFGKLPFEEIFAPAIYYAENGFELNSLNAGMINSRKDVLSRFESTKNIFTNANGEFYKKGDWFQQPELAKTLIMISRQGADYMYNGPWAEKFVKAVQADGGKVTMEDMRRYRVLWTNPIRINYGNCEIFAHGIPAQGGVHVAESLNLMTAADCKSMGHYTESAESFFWMTQMTNNFALSYIPPATQKLIVGKETPLELRCQPNFAAEIWEMMKNGKYPLARKPKISGNNHSDAVVAIDRWGNVAAICHTINTATWGQTGIFVDGISIPDSASFQQQLISLTRPGDRLADPTEPLIVMRDGNPLAALSSIGSGLHQTTISALVNLIDCDQPIEAALTSPSIHLPKFDQVGQATTQVFAGDFSDELLEEVRQMGLDIEVLENNLQSRAPPGLYGRRCH